ncbi:GILT-like protein 1 [Athalia rosae]|uniref:GILT-like protein 1 n=1 Tax=Athalia rosae TaxID=37344 RepID=UPI0020337C41|nr:GILT-like protein 1 [Athalia rosae]
MRRCNLKSHISMGYYLVIVAAIIAVCKSDQYVSTPSSSSSDTVRVHIYYEALCYDSIQFIKHQLIPTFRDLGDYLHITYVPYGKATHEKVTGSDGVSKWRFTCQHGSQECYGNKAQACGIDDILTNSASSDQQRELVAFVGCVMSASYPSNAVPGCLESLGVSASRRSSINDCITSTKGDDLLAAYGDRTHAVDPIVTFVPTIILNGQYSDENQRNAINNFKRTVCRQLAAENKPSTCE